MESLPFEIVEFFEKDKIMHAREELSCLCPYLDSQTLRDFKKDRVVPNLTFTEKIN